MQKAKFILSKSKVLEQFDKIKDLADIISYSSKTNSFVTRILEEKTNCMFSIHMVNELNNIKDKSRVLFLAQAWDEKQIKSLFDMKIHSFVVDNEQDLDVFLDYLRKNSINQKIMLLLRIKLKEMTIRTEKYFVFGMSSELINKKIKEISADKELTNKIAELGIHFHRKTQNMSEWSLKHEISQMFDDDVLKKIKIVNIGGGIPSMYANTNEDVVKTVFNKIIEFKEWLKENKIKLIIEPGRFISAPAIKLVTHILRIYEKNIIVDASVYNADMDALIVPVKLLVENELKENEPGEFYTIKGVTPCSLDIFRYKVKLKNPKEGDEMVFLNAGAYNFTTDFCDLEKIETELID